MPDGSAVAHFRRSDGRLPSSLVEVHGLQLVVLIVTRILPLASTSFHRCYCEYGQQRDDMRKAVDRVRPRSIRCAVAWGSGKRRGRFDRVSLVDQAEQ